MHRVHGVSEVRRQEPGWKDGKGQKMKFQIQEILGDAFQEEGRASELTSAGISSSPCPSVKTQSSERSLDHRSIDHKAAEWTSPFRGTGREGYGHQGREGSPLENRVVFRE